MIQHFKPRDWTAAEKAFVRKHLGTMKRREIAARLNRSYSSVCCFVQSAGFAVRRQWTEEEKRLVIEGAKAKLTSAQIAARLGRRSRDGVEAMRKKLGLSRGLVLGEALMNYIRDRHAEQWSDMEIVEGWNKLHPDRRTGGISRECVSRRRRTMGLPHNRFADRLRNRVRAKTAEQLKAAGLKSLAELHRTVIQKRIADMGWPSDLTMREAQILSLIWEKGPQTKRAIAQALGMRVHQQSRKMLKSEGPGGNYLADLMRRGLLISLGRVCITAKGKGNNVKLYSLPLGIQRGSVSGRACA